MANSTIAEKIAQAETERQRIAANIAAAYDEAEAKGATMPQVQGSANLAQAVASIPTGTAPTLITKQITENGTYTAADDNADGYSDVTINVPDQSKDTLNSLIDRSITTITNDVTSIGGGAFQNCKALTEVSFPNVTSIGGSAFQNCTALTEVSFPKVTSIGASAFNACKALTEVSFPKVASIGSNAFRNCSKLQYFDMSEVDKPPIIATDTFYGTTCIFLFRGQTQLDEYASATNWSTLTNRFQIKGAIT